MSDRPMPDPIVYKGTLGKIVQTMDPHTEADPVGVLGSLLAMLGVAVGSSPHTMIAEHHPVTVWPVLIGNTSTGRKGTATGQAMKVFKAAMPDFARNHVDPTCPSSGAGFVAAVADSTDESGEAGSAPLLMIEEEFVKVMRRSKLDDALGANLRKGWQGRDLAARTKKEKIRVDKCHVGIIGHISPTEWVKYASDSEAAGGTFNRLLPLYVHQSKDLPLGGRLTDDEIQALGGEFRRMAAWGRGVGRLDLTDEAERLWVERIAPEVSALSSGSELIEQFAGRARPYVLRLASLYAIADLRDQITSEDLEAGMALVRYMIESVVYVTPEEKVKASVAGNDLSIEDRIIRLVKAAGSEGVKATQLYRMISGAKKDEIAAVAASCANIEMTVGKSTGGRPPEIYRWVEVGPGNKPAEAPKITRPQVSLAAVEDPRPVRKPVRKTRKAAVRKPAGARRPSILDGLL